MSPSVRRRYSNWIAATAVAVGLVILLPPTPHWRTTSSQSCHVCGNRRIIIQVYRWWYLASETVEPIASFPVPEHHTHDWWEYVATSSSYSQWRAADKSARYRDGRMTWTPGDVPSD